MNGTAKIAYCGLYCPMCSFVVASETKDRQHLEAMPEKYDHLKQHTFEECECAGCREQVDRCHCEMKPCAEKKGLLTCADCADFPCEAVNAFGHDGAPHHADALRNLWRIKEVGYEQWEKEMEILTHCECGARQSWYHRCSDSLDEQPSLLLSNPPAARIHQSIAPKQPSIGSDPIRG